MLAYGVYLKTGPDNGGELMGCNAIFLSYKEAKDWAEQHFIKKSQTGGWLWDLLRPHIYSDLVEEKKVIVPDWEIAEMNVGRRDGKVCKWD